MIKKLLFFTLCFMLSFHSANAKGDDNLTSPAHSGPERNFQKVSNASVIVMTQFGYGTGTVVKYKKNIFVITAKHVVTSRFGEEVSITIVKGDKSVNATVMSMDTHKDIAILSVAESIVEKPLRIEFPRSSIDVGSSVGYCGYPNRRDLSCFVGMISGFPRGYINMHSYAFGGASGSLVVDRSGKAIGVLSAIEVGEFFGLPTPLESVVWIVPIDESSLSSI